jgi:hypothetical protein
MLHRYLANGFHMVLGTTYIERHPRDRFILRNWCSLDEFQTQTLIVELEREDGSRRSPRPHHQMMLHLAR